MESISRVRRKEEQKVRPVSWIEIERHIKKIANKIKRSGKKYKFIYGVPRGGLIPAVLLSHKLDIPLCDSIKDHKSTLVVDDISDSGKTLGRIIEKNGKIDIATIFVRKGSSVMPKFYAAKVHKEWIGFPWEEDT